MTKKDIIEEDKIVPQKFLVAPTMFLKPCHCISWCDDNWIRYHCFPVYSKLSYNNIQMRQNRVVTNVVQCHTNKELVRNNNRSR